MQVGVIVFPGSNCDHDALNCYSKVLGGESRPIWHADTDLGQVDAVIVPGGFSYGDYLRCGAMAKVAPIMAAVKRFADGGGPVLGICNGFQILCEAGLLPGALLQNVQMKFLAQFLSIRVERNDTTFTLGLSKGAVLQCPIAHFEGNFFVDNEMLKRLEGEGQVVFRYCSPAGEVAADNLEWNPNGSLASIAGVCNESRNVVGLMPHPERAVEEIVGFVGSNSGAELMRACMRA